jgi:zinc transport system substrate-binding protein
MTSRLSRTIMLSALPAVALVACGDAPSTSTTSADSELRVAAAFAPIATVVSAVGGDMVDVVSVVPPGTEAHDFEPTAQQVAELEEVDAIFYLGLGFQPGIEDLLAGLGGESSQVDLLNGLTLLEASEDSHNDGDHEGEEAQEGEEAHEGEEESHEGEEGDGHEEGGTDPHVWLDPTNMAAMADVVAAELVALGLDEDAITANVEAFRADMTALDGDFSAGLDSCATTTLVTSHGAFGYLAARYNLEVAPIAGISPTEEPSAQELEDIAEAARDAGVTTVFFEESLPADLAEVVAAEIGAQTAALNPFESLSAEQIEAGETYSSVMRANLEALRAGLNCA